MSSSQKRGGDECPAGVALDSHTARLLGPTGRSWDTVDEFRVSRSQRGQLKSARFGLRRQGGRSLDWVGVVTDRPGANAFHEWAVPDEGST